MEIVNSVMINGQQSFEKHNQLNPVEIKIGDNQVINLLRKKNATYRFIPICLLFSSWIKNNTNQILLLAVV